jgi:F0F1-type ATP synthase assembly protein I
MTRPVQPSKTNLTPAMRFASMGLELVAAIGGMFLLGLGVDWAAGTSPWGKIAGVTVGAAAGMYNFLRTALRETKKANTEFQREHHRYIPTEERDAGGDERST